MIGQCYSRRLLMRLGALVALVILAAGIRVRAAEPVSLFDPQRANYGWTMDNGREFPGAVAKFAPDPTAARDGKPALKLEGDFAKGGKYVEAKIEPRDLDIHDFSCWLRYPGANHLTVRFLDATGQCHQINFKVENTPEWQQVRFPLQSFFANKGKPGALTSVTRYENWGGAKDGQWHGPVKCISILMSPAPEQTQRTLWLSDPQIVPESTGPTAKITTPVRLDEIFDGETDWTFTLGQEFKGAKGSLTVIKDQPAAGQYAQKVAGDFAKGGAYVAAEKSTKGLDLADLSAIRLQVRSANVTSVSIRLTDATGQCHQKKGVAVTADGQWHEMVLRPQDVAGGEHWGGANDGRWHGPLTLFSLILNLGSDSTGGKQPVIDIAGVTAEVMVNAVMQPAVYQESFESSETLPAGWTSEGRVAIDSQQAFKGKRSLSLARPLAAVDTPCSATGPLFEVRAGRWQLGGAAKPELHSPDASFNGRLQLEILNAAGQTLESPTVMEAYGTRAWQPFSQTLTLPSGAAKARFVLRLNKADGQFHLDELSAAFLATAPSRDNRIDRILFASPQMGNLLFPEDKPVFEVTVLATKPLLPEQKELTYVLRDYWGAEYSAPAKGLLEKAGKSGSKWMYKTSLDLSALKLDLGRYYELHAQIVQPGTQAFENYTSFAVLPKAITKQYRPEEIPFTSRNWDNRIKDYFDLSDRLGLRTCGIWGGWSSTPPYKAYAPAIEHCTRLDMGVLTGTPINFIEYHKKGYEKYDETALREGVRNWLAQYGTKEALGGRPLYVNLGNEPHNTMESAKENTPAYKAVYEEIKKFDPSITVIGSSMGPDENYFKCGFQNYLDVYDFHIYEDSVNVRRTMEQYAALFAKYGGKKPIWSTELGLNCQGLTRQVVATELVKKLAIFFAAGGSNVSWFTIIYPDPDAKGAGGSDDSFNVFDCRYNRYAPKLDALAYYHMVNGICIKKFVAEKRYGSDVNAILFRDKDNHCLQVLWKEKGRQDAMIPLPGVSKVTAIHLDGTRREFDARGQGVTLSLTEDPVLLHYDSATAPLAEALGAPAATFDVLPSVAFKDLPTLLEVKLSSAQPAQGVTLEPPPFWNVQATPEAGKVKFRLTAPENTAAREVNLVLPLKDASGAACGELTARVPLTGRFSVTMLPQPSRDPALATVKLQVKNNAPEKQDLTWKMELVDEYPMKDGHYEKPAGVTAYFADVATGNATLEGNSTKTLSVSLAGLTTQTVYRVKATVVDATGRAVSQQRFVAGFAGVPRASTPPKLDGTLASSDWAKAPVQWINEAKQARAVDAPVVPWKGPADLSAKVQFLWDEKYLYLGVTVTDDVFCNTKSDSNIWAGDGLQLLVDPARVATDKPGKYDYAIALGQNGPQAWCYLSADAGAPAGEAKDIRVAAKRAEDGTGGITYEVAIPWSRLAPFKPGVGQNLGLSLALNEDDGKGRHGYVGWYGDPHAKLLDFVGDLILGE